MAFRETCLLVFTASRNSLTLGVDWTQCLSSNTQNTQKLWDITPRWAYEETVVSVLLPFSFAGFSSEGNQAPCHEEHYEKKAHVATNQRRPLATSRGKENSARDHVNETESQPSRSWVFRRGCGSCWQALTAALWERPWRTDLATPGFLVHRNHEIINVCCFELLTLV